MPDEKLKTSVRLSVSTIEAVRQLGYTSTTDAINDGLVLLISRATSTTIEDKGSTKEDSSLENENIILREYNETLKGELEKSNKREEDLKQMHNNYFLQVQTLINQKAIEAHGAKKVPLHK